MKVIKQSDKPLAQISPRLKKFAEVLATGLYTKVQAALMAGYPQTTADAKSYIWIGYTREESYYPSLFDYYEKLNKQHLRTFDANIKTITSELVLIGFSDVTRFVDLPSEEFEKKAILARDIDTAFQVAEEWKYYQKAKRDFDEKQADKRRKEPTPPEPPTSEQIRLLQWFRDDLTQKEQNDTMFWLHYKRGSIRIKNIEDIPKALLPAIAEIAETKDGIKIKLHDKLSALDKLARIHKLYDAEREGEEKFSKIKEINIHVNGSKSTLLLDEPE